MSIQEGQRPANAQIDGGGANVGNVAITDGVVNKPSMGLSDSDRAAMRRYAERVLREGSVFNVSR